MLRWRLILAGIAIPALIALVWLDARALQPGLWLFPLAVVVGVAGSLELVDLLQRAGYRPHRAVTAAGTLLVIASNAVPIYLEPSGDRALERLAWPCGAFVLTLLVAFLVEMSQYRQPGGTVVQLALATFAVAYVGLLLSFAIQLRLLGDPAQGLIGLVAWIAVVKAGDIGAYTVGRLFGRHKMAPTISPGKTLEGAAGAVAFSALAAWLTFTYLPPLLDGELHQHPQAWLLFGVLVGLAGLFGDLAESLIKRDLGTKDSSRWMPGFGGVLDLIDSLLFSAPVAYWCWLVM